MGKYPEGYYDIVMVNEDLSSLTLETNGVEILEKEGCSLIAYAPGMEKEWLSIQDRSDKYNDFEAGRFAQVFGNDLQQIRERVIFIQNAEGLLVGTAAAWIPHDEWTSEYGRIHWVAIVPEYQGRGLSKVLISHLIDVMKSMDYTKSYLNTNTIRKAAIALYRRYGFEIISEKGGSGAQGPEEIGSNEF